MDETIIQILSDATIENNTVKLTFNSCKIC